jgi:hypothetical protein
LREIGQPKWLFHLTLMKTYLVFESGHSHGLILNHLLKILGCYISCTSSIYAGQQGSCGWGSYTCLDSGGILWGNWWGLLVWFPRVGACGRKVSKLLTVVALYYAFVTRGAGKGRGGCKQGTSGVYYDGVSCHSLV